MEQRQNLMEWSKEKTMRLIGFLQGNPNIWNPSASESRRIKQKRKEELKYIAKAFNVCVLDITKKIQHLRTQYNREAAREARTKAEDPEDKYESNWYAFEYLHFLKGSNKSFRFLDISSPNTMPYDYNEEATPQNNDISMNSNNRITKFETLAEPHTVNVEYRDEFSIFGEYVAHELRSLKGEKNRLMAKKRIQDALFELKLESIQEATVHPTIEQVQSTQHSVHNCKLYTTTQPFNPTSQTETGSHAEQQSNMGEIIINSACHYPTLKVDVHTHKMADDNEKTKLYSTKLSAFSM